MDPVNILVVDDDSSNLTTLQHALGDSSYRLVMVQSGEDALKWLTTDDFGLVILDIHMPDMDGFALARKIREQCETPIPLMFLTGVYTDLDKMAEGYDLGAVDYIYRPVSLKILRAKVANLIDLYRKTVQLTKQAQQLRETEQALEQRIRERTLQVQAQLRRTEALYNVTRSLVGQGGIDDLLRTVVDSVAQALPADLLAILIIDMEAETTLDVVLGGPRRDDWYPLTFAQVIEGLPGQALTSGKPVLSTKGVLRPYRDSSGALQRDPGSVLVAPLHFQSIAYGVLMAINWGEDNKFTTQDLDLLDAMANQAAVAISQADIFDDTLRTLTQVRRVIQSVPSGVVLLDAQHKILLENPIATSYLESIAEIDSDRRLVRLGAIPLTEFIVSELTTSNHLHPNDKHSLPIGEQMFEVMVRPLTDVIASDSHYDREQWILILRDITVEMVALDHQLTQQRQAVVGQLAAGVAHDFNNILAVITLYCQLLQKDPEREKRTLYLATIQQQANRGAVLISQLLDFGRQSLMKPTSVDLVPFLSDIVNLIARTFPENIDIHFVTHVESLYVHVDPTHLQQVFMNLAINARDAMSESGEFHLGLESMDLGLHEVPPIPGMVPGLWAKVTVRDSGCGMSPEVTDKIFEPFFTTKAPDQGTGLGLAQVYGIIQQLGGEITVASLLGQGSSFTVYLPIEGLISVPLTKVSEPRSDNVATDSKRILLVEDEPAVRSALEDMLSNLGFADILVAENGAEALEHFRSVRGQIDLVLSDMVMPQMGGLELFEVLRDEQPNIKMIISTGYPLEGGGEALLERGIVDWVLKPFSLEEVTSKIYKALTG